ncbi:MAG: phosphoenolpyruvate--protein phosphotransferase [Clostridia bacterium]|nr:phosphoenolpyruvate--protein phosphotransferase [Clostridia bacterium]
MIKGKGISEGVGLGKVVILKSKDIKTEKIKIENTELEKEAFYEAIHEVETETQQLINKLSGTEKEIMEAYAALLQDPTLIEEVIKIIEQEKCNAAYATQIGFNNIIQIFEQMDDSYMSARSRDIEDMKNKVLAKIFHEEYVDLGQLEKHTILIAKELTTSDTAKLDFKNISGIVTEIGGVNSHMAIMARTHNIPVIVGIKQIMKQIKESDFVAINGTTGEVFINPSEEECGSLEEINKKVKQEREELENYKNKISQTKDGHNVELLSNIGLPEDIELIIKNTAEGVRII